MTVDPIVIQYLFHSDNILFILATGENLADFWTDLKLNTYNDEIGYFKVY